MSQARILVVEDENIVAMDIKDKLESLGYIVSGVANCGQGAIQKAVETSPDLVLMDIKLAGAMDGVDAATQIRARLQLPVVYLTAFAENNTLQRAKITEPGGYILKPFREQEVKAAIEMALYKHRTEAAIREYNRRLLTLHSAGTAIASSLDLRHVLETVAKQMVDLLEVAVCTAFAWDEIADAVSCLCQFSTNGRSSVSDQANRFPLTRFPLTERALLDRHPQQRRLGDHNLHPDEQAYMQAASIQTLVVVPMVAHNRVVGLVELLDQVERKFADQELTLAQLLANQAASAIENTRLYDELCQRVAELTTLNLIGQAITSSLDLKETLTIITDHTVRLLDAAAASVALRDEVNGDLWFAAASGEVSDLIQGERLAMNQGIIGWVMRHGEPVLVPHVTRDRRFFDGFDKKAGFDTRSILCVPLVCKGQTIGVIEAINKRSGAFDQEDERLLNSLAAPASAAIENARLYELAQAELAERKRAEAALEAERALLARRVAEQTAELRAANVELAEAASFKDRFISNASHELRTPLSVLTLLSGNLARLYDRWSDDQRRNAISDIREQVRALNALIKSMLELSCIDNERVSSVHRPVNLAQLLREEVEKQQLLAQDKSQTLRVTGVQRMTVSGNEGQLRRVMRNLVNNAIKYTPEGGQIACECQIQTASTDTTEWPEASALPPGRWAALRVIDNGIGISQADLPRIYERFYRAQGQENATGAGLGLSIAKELVQAHAGHIAVTSTLGEGTIFAVYLPLEEKTHDERGRHSGS